MNTGSNKFTNPDAHAALSESLLKQGIAKTKLDADRMATGMTGAQQNKRPSGQQFNFGFDDAKTSDAKIENYSGPSKLPNQTPGIIREEVAEIQEQTQNKNRFLDAAPQAPSVDINLDQQNYNAFNSLHAKIQQAQEEIVDQRSVIESLKNEIANLKQTHEVFHSRMEELHTKVGQSESVPQQKPFIAEPAVSQLDTMMQQPSNMQERNQALEKKPAFVKEIVREVEVAEDKMSEDDKFIQKAQAENPVPKHKVVDIDLGNIFK